MLSRRRVVKEIAEFDAAAVPDGVPQVGFWRGDPAV